MSEGWALAHNNVPSGAIRPKHSGSKLRAHIGFNFYGAGNIGDDLMLFGFLQAMQQRGDRISLTCCSPYSLAPLRRRFPQIDWRPDTEAEREEAMRHADIWLGVGATTFQLKSGQWQRDHLL
jgi:polysaccharide pyruvyl transferase WcaK-like protein